MARARTAAPGLEALPAEVRLRAGRQAARTKRGTVAPRAKAIPVVAAGCPAAELQVAAEAAALMAAAERAEAEQEEEA